MLNPRFVGLTAIALCLESTVLSAQRVTDIEKGIRVRITEFHGPRFSESFVASTTDSLSLIADGSSVVRSTPSADVTGFGVSTGRHRAQGALIRDY